MQMSSTLYRIGCFIRKKVLQMFEGAAHASRVIQANELRSVYLSPVWSNIIMHDVYD